MSDVGPKSVADLRSLGRDGEESVFRRTTEPTGNETDFYWVHTQGEFLNIQPIWEVRPPRDNPPRPKTRAIANKYTPLSSIAPVRFHFNGARDRLADFYQVDTFYYLLSDKLADLILRSDPAGAEAIPANVNLADGSQLEFKLLMPIRVLDAVDTAKTGVTVVKREYEKGSGRFVTHTRYDSGYVLRSDQLAGVQTFVEEFMCHWLWRLELFLEAVSAGGRGFYAEYTCKTSDRPEIRLEFTPFASRLSPHS